MEILMHASIPECQHLSIILLMCVFNSGACVAVRFCKNVFAYQSSTGYKMGGI